MKKSIKVAEFLASVEAKHGKVVRKLTYQNLQSWAGNEPNLTQAFYSEDSLNDMLNYALADLNKK